MNSRIVTLSNNEISLVNGVGFIDVIDDYYKNLCEKFGESVVYFGIIAIGTALTSGLLLYYDPWCNHSSRNSVSKQLRLVVKKSKKS